MEGANSCLSELKEKYRGYLTVPTDRLKCIQEQYSVKLRKGKRLEKVTQRRMDRCPAHFINANLLEILAIPEFLFEFIPHPFISEHTLYRTLRELLLVQNDMELILQLLQFLILAIETGGLKVVENITSYNMLKSILKYCKTEYPMPIIDAACWCICLVSAGPLRFCTAIIENNGIYTLMQLIANHSMSSCEHAVAAIANLAMENNEIRQQLIDSGIIELMKTLFKEYSNPSQELAKSIAWILAYIAKNSLDFTLTQAETISKICISLLEDEEDEETQVKCMFAFANICRNPAFVRTVISRGVKP